MQKSPYFFILKEAENVSDCNKVTKVLQKGLYGFLFLLSDADDFRIFAIESRIVVEAEIVGSDGFLDTVEDHVVGGNDLFGANILHDGGLHVLLEAVGQIGFGEVEVIAERFQGDAFLEMGVDVVDDGTDDVVLPCRWRNAVALLGKKDEELDQFGKEKRIDFVLVLELLDVVIEAIEIEEEFHRVRMEGIELVDPFGQKRRKDRIREFEDVSFVWDLKIADGEMIFSARDDNDVSGLKLSAFRFHMVNDVPFDEVEDLVEIMHVPLEVLAGRGRIVQLVGKVDVLINKTKHIDSMIPILIIKSRN